MIPHAVLFKIPFIIAGHSDDAIGTRKHQSKRFGKVRTSHADDPAVVPIFGVAANGDIAAKADHSVAYAAFL